MDKKTQELALLVLSATSVHDPTTIWASSDTKGGIAGVEAKEVSTCIFGSN
jgi:hypothetical protein